MSSRETLESLGWRVGWRAVRLLPEPAAYGAFHWGAGLGYRRQTPGVVRLRANYRRIHPGIADEELESLVREGMRRYGRYFAEAFRLADLTAADVDARVTAVGIEPVRAHIDDGGSVVAFLGHMGNWDLAGAWAARQLRGVTTVAEHLRPESVFRQFMALREALGMTIVPLDAEGGAFKELVKAAKRPGLIPLLADRDLTRTGVEVQFAGHRARMAAGPAALALATGSPLVPITIRHCERGRGWGIELTFHDAIPIPEGPRSEATAAMTQRCADVLAGVVREHTADWHMLQRIFVADLDPTRGPQR